VLSEVMEHYGLALPFDEVGFFTTEHHQKIIRQMKAAIQAGRLVALSGLVGPFPTVTLVANSGALIGEADRPFPGVNKRREEDPNVVTPR
jgi:type II secretory pathway predicted ATPase ExeA